MTCEHNSGPPRRVVRSAARRLLGQHRLVRLRRASALDDLLAHVAGPAALEHGRLRPWLDLLVRAYCACGGRLDGRDVGQALTSTAASFAATVWALEILDDLADGDEPDAGRQAPNLALALIGEAMALLSRLPPATATGLLALWGSMWTHCAAAQARDVSLSRCPDLTIAQALGVAEGSGLVTRWAVEAGAVLAGAPPDLVAPLAQFGEHLGTAEKLLHDVHDLWPGAHRSHDLRRPSCNLALAIARHDGAFQALAKTATHDDRLRRHLLVSGALHHAWAYADQYRLDAGDALVRFGDIGGDTTWLAHSLALTPDLRGVEHRGRLPHAHDMMERPAGRYPGTSC